MNTKRIFIGAASLLMSFALSAVEVSSDDVELVAKGWARDNAGTFGKMGAFKSVKAELDASGQVLWHWVILEKGALVVAPDTEIEPVIAALPGSDGTLPANHPMRALLRGDLARRLAQVRAQTSGTGGRSLMAAAPLSPLAAKWKRLKDRGNPRPSFLSAPYTVGRPATIVKWLDGWNEENNRITGWKQDEDYSAYTPLVEGPLGPMNAVVGCVATAGSAILHYFRVSGCASNIVSACRVDGVETNLCTRGGAYDWSLIDDMEDIEAVGDLVARVSYDVGILSHMSYTAGASGAYGFDLATALRKHFGLASARYVNQYGPGGGNRASISSDFYPDLVYNQIRAGSPVIFGIDSTTATDPVGHEVVACGYGIDTENTDYTFIFCGWAGEGDAWYALPHIDTKATVGSAMAEYDTIGEMIVSLSTNACYVPLVGRVVDTDGLPVTNDLWLADGTLVHPDANGYWGVRIKPTEKVIYDPVGDPHAFVVGADAVTPKTFFEESTKDAIAAETLAAALPDAMEIVVKREQIDKGFEIISDYETAVRRALAEGKLLYVFGGADEAAVAALKDDFRASSNETFFASYVFWQVDATRYPTLAQSPFFAGAADPRTINPYGAWSEANGQWTEGLEAWKSVSRKAVSGGLTLTGPTVVNTAASGSYKYVLTVAYGDGVVTNLNSALVGWTVDATDKASVNLGYLSPVCGATGPLTLTAAVPNLFGEKGLSAVLTVTLTDGPCVIVGGSSTNTCIIAVDDDANVLDRALEIAQGDQSGNPGLILPRYIRNEFDETTPAYGSILTMEMQASRTFEKNYILRCVGLEVVADGAVVTNVAFDANSAAKTVTYDYKVCGAVTRVGWQWKTDKYYVELGSAGNATLDRETGYYPAGSNLVVNVLSGTEINANREWVAVWSGCSRLEAGETSATLNVDHAPRNVWAHAVNVSDETDTYSLKVPSTNGLVVAKGYKIELVQVNEGNPDWGEPTTYFIKVVRGDTPDPKEVEPPKAVSGLVYDGTCKTGVVESAGFTLTGNVATNAGTYLAVAKLSDGYVWTGGGLGDVEVHWTIESGPTPPGPGPEPEPEYVSPGPIAFMSIEKVGEKTWSLVITNRVPFCNYRLLHTDDLSKGFVHTGAWEQAAADADPAWTTNVVIEGVSWFWKAEAKEGQKPAE